MSTLWDPVDCSPPGPSVLGILQARMLEWIAISFSRGSSRPRDRTQLSCIAGRCFNLWATREAQSSVQLEIEFAFSLLALLFLHSFHCLTLSSGVQDQYLILIFVCLVLSMVSGMTRNTCLMNKQVFFTRWEMRHLVSTPAFVVIEPP